MRSVSTPFGTTTTSPASFLMPVEKLTIAALLQKTTVGNAANKIGRRSWLLREKLSLELCTVRTAFDIAGGA